MPTKETIAVIKTDAQKREDLTHEAAISAIEFVRAFSAWRKGKDEDRSRLADEMFGAFFKAEKARLSMEIAFLRKIRDDMKAGGPVALEA